MGSIFGKAMDENMEKQQKFMLMTQKMQMERQMHMQNNMREQQMAMQLARARDVFNFFSAFYVTVATGGILSTLRTKKPFGIIPTVLLSFPLAYQYDLAHGNKMERLRAEADRILREERGLLDMPEEFPPSLQRLDELRKAAEKK